MFIKSQVNIREILIGILLAFLMSNFCIGQTSCTFKLIYSGSVKLDDSKKYVMNKVQFPSTEFLLGEESFHSYYGFYSTDLNSEVYNYSTLSHENEVFCGDMESIINTFKSVEIYPISFMVAYWDKDTIAPPAYKTLEIEVDQINFIIYDTRTILIEFPEIDISSF